MCSGLFFSLSLSFFFFFASLLSQRGEGGKVFGAGQGRMNESARAVMAEARGESVREERERRQTPSNFLSRKEEEKV